MDELSQTVGLALDGLEQFLLESAVGRVEWHTHALATGGGYWQGVDVTDSYHIHGDAQV